MSYMFSGCSSLAELNLKNFNTKSVTNMIYMFCGCSSLKRLDLSNFNTNNVIYMNDMFFGCSSLEELNLSNFTTDKTAVDGVNWMFKGCSDELKSKIEVQYNNIRKVAFI